MKVRTVMVTVAASAAALSFAAAGSAAAQTLGHPVQRMPASVSQVTGSRLVKGLLPASAFGPSFYLPKGGTISSGGKLTSTRVKQTPGSLSCGTFVNENYTTGWGNTAGAGVLYVNSAWTIQNSAFTLYSVVQDVVQFATAHAASTFFSQAYAKLSACRSFVVPNPGDTSPGGGSYTVSDTSTSKTHVSGHQAFWTSELWALSEGSRYNSDVEILYAVSGTDVYYLWENNGTNDEPSPALMSDLIHRVQSL
jgi:PknH-like extracellular domain